MINTYICDILKFLLMARQKNDNRKSTPVMIEKTLKGTLDTLRNPDSKRKGNESDNTVIKRIVEIVTREHPELIHDPRNTYTSKSS